EVESHRPQDERRQQREHRQVEPGERGRVQQRPGRKRGAAAEDEPDLVALPDRLDGAEQHPALVVVATDEAERRADAEIEAVRDREADQQCAEDPPPDQPQRLVVRHGRLRYSGQYPSPAGPRRIIRTRRYTSTTASAELKITKPHSDSTTLLAGTGDPPRKVGSTPSMAQGCRPYSATIQPSSPAIHGSGSARKAAR